MKNFLKKIGFGKNSNIGSNEEITKKEAIEYLDIPEKNFENYFKNSKEIKGFQEKKGARWKFNKVDLDKWKKSKDERTIKLTLHEYEKCFEFAIKMVYSGLSLHGIRGQRSEVQAADDVILGILGEHAIKKFLKDKFNTEIELDEEVHPENITPQDFNLIKEGNKLRTLKLGVGVKGSKLKSAFLVLGQKEVELPKRKSDVYVFVRVDLPSDHLFRILKEHSFFKRAKQELEVLKKEHPGDNKRKIIEELKEIPVWICGLTYLKDLEKVTEIPGQSFENGYRYVKSVSNMRNSDKDWLDLIKKL